MRILVVSDTHGDAGNLRKALLMQRKAEVVIHLTLDRVLMLCVGVSLIRCFYRCGETAIGDPSFPLRMKLPWKERKSIIPMGISTE